MKRCYFAVLFLCLGATRISAQTEPAWGTTAETALVVGSFAFQPYKAGVTTDTVIGTADRFITSGGAGDTLVATFQIPSGAQITGLEFQGCHTSVAYTSFIYILHYFQPGSDQVIGFGNVPTNSGCGKFRTNLSHTVDATDGPYLLLWQPSAFNSTQLLTAMRVYYKLQISPDPATATFADVPVGHPFHRFVEALVAAGITGGCGGGNYCPDAPVTRGQMAVFLSAALGLHWAP
jgi:hypothetical protein